MLDFGTKRDFQVWSYSVSHSVLILQGHKAEHLPRVVIGLKGVKRVSLSTSFLADRLTWKKHGINQLVAFASSAAREEVECYCGFIHTDDEDYSGEIADFISPPRDYWRELIPPSL